MSKRAGTVAIVLAAGSSSRLGSPKQLLVHRGRTLVRAAVEESLGSECDRVVVVLGARAREIRAAIAGLAVDVVLNRAWSEGIASSIRCGVSWAMRQESRAVIVVVCDQPALRAAQLDRLVHAHVDGVSIVASRYGDAVGVPALFARSELPALAALRGDAGAKHVIRARGAVAIEWPEGAYDIDTREDAARACE